MLVLFLARTDYINVSTKNKNHKNIDGTTWLNSIIMVVKW